MPNVSSGGFQLARSYLFAPGSHERLVRRAFSGGADAVVIDLEDAVASEHKALARSVVAKALADRGRVPGGPLVYVRINSVPSGLWEADLDSVVGPWLDGVRIAHTNSRAELEAVDRHLAALERDRGLAPGSVGVVASIETALAVERAAEIARAPRVRALAFGGTDFLRDVGGAADPDEHGTLLARSHLVVASRSAGILPPIASVHPSLPDLDGLRRTSEAARRLGFFGRSCLHPAQIPVIHEAFTPGQAEVGEARALVDAFDRQAAAGEAAVMLADGQLVERGVVDRARALLALAERLAARPAPEPRVPSSS